MAEEEKGNPDSFVTHSEFAPIVKDVNMIKLALFGSDMRGGIVKDIEDIKHTIETMSAVNAYRVMKDIGIPIVVTVITAWIISSVI